MAMNFNALFVTPLHWNTPFFKGDIKNYIALRKLTSDLATPFIARQHVNVSRGSFHTHPFDRHNLSFLMWPKAPEC